MKEWAAWGSEINVTYSIDLCLSLQGEKDAEKKRSHIPGLEEDYNQVQLRSKKLQECLKEWSGCYPCSWNRGQGSPPAVGSRWTPNPAGRKPPPNT